MAAPAVCPQCRGTLPNAAGGLCPRCLAEGAAFLLEEESANLEEGAVAESGETHASWHGWLNAGNDAVPRPDPADDFEIRGTLGRGGMGVIYRAWQKSLEREVAVKVIAAGALGSPEQRARFRSEARAAARLDHPHIVPVYEVGEIDGQPFFAMKLAAGGSLDSAWPAPESLTPAERRARPRAAAALVAKLARAVHHAHERGILHRDLKPANILFDAGGEPLVADFSLAKLLDEDSQWTRSGTALGSPNYMSPEQVEGQPGRITCAADVWGLGALFYNILTGRPPFSGRTVLETMRAVAQEDPVPPDKWSPECGKDLSAVCLRCLEKKPARRYASAAALADDLEAWLSGGPVTARPPGRIAASGRWMRRHPWAAVSFLAVLAAAALGWWHAGEVGRERDLARAAEAVARSERTRALDQLFAADLRQAALAIESGNFRQATQILEAHREGPESKGPSSSAWRWLAASSRASVRWSTDLPGPGPFAVALLGGSGRVAAVGESGDILLFEGESGKPAGRLPGFDSSVSGWKPEHDGPRLMVPQLVASPDGSWLFHSRPSGGWHLLDTRERKIVQSGPDGAAAAAFRESGDAVVCCLATLPKPDSGRSPVVVEITGRSGAWSRRVLGPSGVPAAFENTGNWLLAGGARPEAPLRWLWLRGGGEDAGSTMAGSRPPVPSSGLPLALAVAPDGGEIAVSSGGGGGLRFRRFRRNGDRYPERPPEPPQDIPTAALTYSADGRWLAVATLQETLNLLPVDGEGKPRTLRGTTGGRVGSLACTPDAESLWTVSAEGRLTAWTAAAADSRVVARHQTSALVMNAAGTHALGLTHPDAGVLGGRWQWLTLGENGVSLPLEWPAKVQPLYLAADGSSCGVLVDGVWQHWRRGETVPSESVRITGFPATAGPVLVTADHRWLVAAGGPGGTELWAGPVRGPLLRKHRFAGRIESMSASADAAWLVLAVRDEPLRLVSLTDPTEPMVFPQSAVSRSALALSDDGKMVALTTNDMGIQLRNTETGEVVAELPGHASRTARLAFASDRRTLVSICFDGQLKWWDLPSGREIASTDLQLHSRLLHFSNDGTRLSVLAESGDLLQIPIPEAP